MRYLLMLWMLAAPALSATIVPRIVGGEDSTPATVPWQVLLDVDFDGQEYTCGGTYIGNRYVLTAAHCVMWWDGTKASGVQVHGGQASAIEMRKMPGVVSTFRIHPQFDPMTLENDIAIVRLATNLPEAIKPIKMASPEEHALAEAEFANSYNHGGLSPENLLVSGWGRDKADGFLASTLQMAFMTGIADDQCKDILNAGYVPFEDHMAEIFMCATSPSPTVIQEACLGDSGGPLVWQNPNNVGDSDFGLRLLGVVSYGFGCDAELPSGFTEVGAYQEYISLNTAKLPDTATFSIDPFGNGEPAVTPEPEEEVVEEVVEEEQPKVDVTPELNEPEVVTPAASSGGGGGGTWGMFGIFVIALMVWRRR